MRSTFVGKMKMLPRRHGKNYVHSKTRTAVNHLISKQCKMHPPDQNANAIQSTAIQLQLYLAAIYCSCHELAHCTTVLVSCIIQSGHMTRLVAALFCSIDVGYENRVVSFHEIGLI